MELSQVFIIAALVIAAVDVVLTRSLVAAALACFFASKVF